MYPVTSGMRTYFTRWPASRANANMIPSEANEFISSPVQASVLSRVDRRSRRVRFSTRQAHAQDPRKSGLILFPIEECDRRFACPPDMPASQERPLTPSLDWQA